MVFPLTTPSTYNIRTSKFGLIQTIIVIERILICITEKTKKKIIPYYGPNDAHFKYHKHYCSFCNHREI